MVMVLVDDRLLALENFDLEVGDRFVMLDFVQTSYILGRPIIYHEITGHCFVGFVDIPAAFLPLDADRRNDHSPVLAELLVFQSDLACLVSRRRHDVLHY